MQLYSVHISQYLSWLFWEQILGIRLTFVIEFGITSGGRARGSIHSSGTRRAASGPAIFTRVGCSVSPAAAAVRARSSHDSRLSAGNEHVRPGLRGIRRRRGRRWRHLPAPAPATGERFSHGDASCLRSAVRDKCAPPRRIGGRRRRGMEANGGEAGSREGMEGDGEKVPRSGTRLK